MQAWPSPFAAGLPLLFLGLQLHEPLLVVLALVFGAVQVRLRQQLQFVPNGEPDFVQRADGWGAVAHIDSSELAEGRTGNWRARGEATKGRQPSETAASAGVGARSLENVRCEPGPYQGGEMFSWLDNLNSACEWR